MRWSEIGRILLAVCVVSSLPACGPQARVDAQATGVELIAGLEAAPAAGPHHINFFIENRSDEPLDVPVWNTPLENPLSADVFDVRYGGKPVAYIGRMVKRDASKAPHVRLEAGERRSVEIDLDTSYTMEQAGPYEVRYRPATIQGQAMLDLDTPILVPAEALVLP